MAEQTALGYIKNQMAGFGNFVGEWKKLPEKDKADLKAAAESEMKATATATA